MSANDKGKYACNQCEYQNNKGSNIKIHTLNVHQGGTQYKCNQCAYNIRWKQKLSAHQGVTYACYKYEYQATQQDFLRKHKVGIHEKLMYNCNQCYTGYC